MNVGLAQKIELAAVCGNDLAILALEPPRNRRACHAAMTRHPDALSGQVKITHGHVLGVIPRQSPSDPTPPSQRPVPGSRPCAAIPIRGALWRDRPEAG